MSSAPHLPPEKDNRDWLKQIKAAEFKDALNILAEYGDGKWKSGDKAGFRRGYARGKEVGHIEERSRPSQTVST